MNTLYKINKTEFDTVYTLFEMSFPPAELRPYHKMKRFFNENILVIYAMKKQNEIIMGLLCWEFDNFTFLENFAVHPSFRRKGIGTSTLQQIKTLYSNLLVLEVEEPYDKLSFKRISFYERNGFYLTKFGYDQPPLNPSINDIPLKIMSNPYKINENEFFNIKKQIFRRVYEKSLD